MGVAFGDLTLKNPRLPELQGLNVHARVDTEALLLRLPEHVVIQLKLESDEVREVTTADGKRHVVPYVGPLEVRFENRRCYVGALAFGDEVLLGSVPMGDLDVIISPAHRKLVVNPDSPNIPQALVK